MKDDWCWWITREKSGRGSLSPSASLSVRKNSAEISSVSGDNNKIANLAAMLDLDLMRTYESQNVDR